MQNLRCWNKLTAALMQVITICQTTLMGNIESVQLDIGLVCKDMDKFCTRLLMEDEHHMGESEDILHENAATLHTLKTKVKALELQAEDAENRTRGLTSALWASWRERRALTRRPLQNNCYALSSRVLGFRPSLL